MGKDQQTTRVMCVMGGPRTGTHLLNSLLCTSPGVMPLLRETAPVVVALRAFAATVGHMETFPGMHFSNVGEVVEVHACVIGAFARHLLDRYSSRICVFRSPLLTRHAHDLRTLAVAAGLTPRMLCMVRDPRDVVASMRAWNQRKTAAGGRPLIDDADEAAALARWYSSYYTTLLSGGAEDLLFLRYEDVVREPSEAARCINEFADLSIDLAASASGWAGARMFAPDDARPEPAITELYGKRPTETSVGRWRKELGPIEAKQSVRECGELIGRFYPDLVLEDIAERSS